MIISINQPAYLPWLGYFDRIARSDLHVVLDHVQFEKNSFTNRNKILLGGKSLWLTVPVMTKGKFGNISIDSLLIDNKVKWQKKHWHTIRQAYSKCDYWNDVNDHFQSFYQFKGEKIIDILDMSRDFILDYLGLKIPIISSSPSNYTESKSNLILEICKRYGATKYLSGPLGLNYLDEESFLDNNIEIIYHNYANPFYPQKSKEFVPFLSILDLIANCGKQSLRILKND